MSNQNGELMRALGAVEDPVLFQLLSELGTLRSVSRSWRGVTKVVVCLPGDPYPAIEELRRRVVGALPGESEVDLVVEVMAEREQVALGMRLKELAGTLEPGPGGDGSVSANPFTRPKGATRVLVIASGKGGVGKSSVTVNLAVGLARLGRTVGLLDADIYGFSTPRMLGVAHPPTTVGRTLVPPVAHGVRVISMGFFADEDKGVAWRGPMLHKAIEQFLTDVHWGAPQFLLVDMPPGTGDVALSVAQHLPSAEVYVVTTPQLAAQRVARRAASLARDVRLPVRGVIENMSWFEAPDGSRYDLFGSGGGAALAEALEVPLLAQIPLDQAVRQGADDGHPAAEVAPSGVVTKIFDDLAARVDSLGPARVYRKELTVT